MNRISLLPRIAFVLLLLGWLLACSMLTGCTTQRKVEKWNATHPVKAAAYCAKTFPPVIFTEVKTDTLTDTLTITQPLYVSDTLYLGGDTVVLKTKCPPSQLITKVIRDSVKIRVRDSAAIYALHGELKAKEKEIAILSAQKKQAEERAKEKATELWWHRLLIVVLLLWIFRKPILNLLNPIKKLYPF